MTTGTVMFFNASKGFGLISPEGGGNDVLVCAATLKKAGLCALSDGQKVNFDIRPKDMRVANLSLQ